MWSLWPIAALARRVGIAAAPLEHAAERSWEIAPPSTAVAPRAYFLDGQLDRVTGWAFASEHPRRQVEGGHPVEHAATRAFLLRDAFLLDGVLFKGNPPVPLNPRRARLPSILTNRHT